MGDFETNKKFLRRYRPYFRQIKRLETKLFVIDDRIESTHSPSMTGQPGGGKRRELADDLIQREEIEGRINRLIKKSRPIKSEITDCLDELTNSLEASILEQYFIEDIQLDTIALQMSYSFRQVKRLYGDGVKHAKIPKNCDTL
ncbi:hypothetical protein [Lactiplantibacillus plantarum]|uniref:hypothetical protein n=1 Tax=Lactiplantibacillus plantarum TaxID=1590 RepID=UPI001AAE6B62|nr:hypothetical protein [Lactiplantibacillus plantarum]MBO2724803.1 hypothetical protein [Lactiplantibacillus plantarum]